MTKFDVIRVLDEWRWAQPKKNENNAVSDELYRFEIETYPFYNEYKEICELNKELPPELAKKILLTHYLVYICDRQMDYRFIFRYGGYVIGQILQDYLDKIKNQWNTKLKEEEFLDFITEHTAAISKKDKSGNETYSHYLKAKKPDEKQKNISYKDFNIKYNKILNDYQGDDKNDIVLFASRMTINDYYCLFRTLYNISDFNNLLYDKNLTIDSLAEGFFNCTYKGVKSKDKSNNNISGKYEKDFSTIYKLYDENRDDSTSFSTKRTSSKRLWCIVRDYMYNPLFCKCFEKVVGSTKFNALYDQRKDIELPGDVWNNNLKFAQCFWGISDDVSKINASEKIRDEFDKNPDLLNVCFPIQFDVTFNFVPRMCSVENCAICPLAEFSQKSDIQDLKGQWQEKICHKKDGQYCTLALYAAGIKHVCKGENCELIKGEK